jgi:hypothetical protein
MYVCVKHEHGRILISENISYIIYFFYSFEMLQKPKRNSGESRKYMAWVRARLCKLQKGCTRLAAASDKVYQLLDHGRWFSPGIPASSTTKTGRHDIAEILLKVALNTKNQNQIKIN